MPSIRVNLYFENDYDNELLSKLPDYDGLLRLKGTVTFRKLQGWTEVLHAIIDTGAHTSTLPKWLWSEIERTKLTDHHVRGLVPGKECVMDVEVAWVRAMIVDVEGNRTDEIRFRALLVPSDEIPIVIGFKDLLERFEVCFNFPQRRAHIESR